MLRKTLASFAILTILVSLSACTSKQEVSKELNKEGKPSVAATIFPLYDLVRQVAGDRAVAVLVLEPGASPHTYEASPGKIKELADTKAIFAIGAGLDAWASDITTALPATEVIAMDRYAILKPFIQEEHDHRTGSEHGTETTLNEEGEEHGHNAAEEHGAESVHDEEENDHGHEHGSNDPHYWLDPAQSGALLEGIAKELGRLDPSNSQYYLDNAASYQAEIAARLPAWQEKLSALPSKELAVFHDAWSYFATAFGLGIALSFEPFPGQAPSPTYLAKLHEEAKEHDVRALFVEPQFSAEAVKTIASDLGLKVDVLDPIGGVSGRDTYIDLIDYNVETIYRNLNDKQ